MCFFLFLYYEKENVDSLSHPFATLCRLMDDVRHFTRQKPVNNEGEICLTLLVHRTIVKMNYKINTSQFGSICTCYDKQ